MAAATVRDNILALFDTLSPKQRQLARFFLDNEDMVAFTSANDIAERAGASAATVVRFCRALGYDGYPDLQAAIRTRFPQYRTMVQRMADRLANGGLAENLPQRVAQANSQNIQVSLSQISDQALAAAVEALIQARHIHIFASGLSAAAAVLAEHTLISLGLSARACLNGRTNQVLETSLITNQDLVIVISIWRYLRDTTDAARAAHAVGATCIALTDSLVAPTAAVADHIFVTATEGAAHSRSLSGILSIIDLLGAAIALRRPKESMDALQRIDQLYRQNGLLVGE